VLDVLVTFAEQLREEGFDVSASELIDASRAVCLVDIADKALVRDVLRSTMVKEADTARRFDAVFERVFRVSGQRSEGVAVGTSSPTGPSSHGAPTTTVPPARPGSLDDEVLAALLERDADALVALAIQAVDSFSGIGGTEGSERYFLHRVLRAMDLSRMLSAAMQQLRRDESLDDLELMLRRNEIAQGLEEFRRRLASEIAARVHEQMDDAGIDIPERTAPEDLDLLGGVWPIDHWHEAFEKMHSGAVVKSVLTPV